MVTVYNYVCVSYHEYLLVLYEYLKKYIGIIVAITDKKKPYFQRSAQLKNWSKVS